MKLLYISLFLALSSTAIAQSGAHSSWEKLGPIQFAALAQQGQSTVVATTTNGYIYVSNDFGLTWRHQCIDDTMQLGDIEFFDSLHGIVNASVNEPNYYINSAIYQTSDGGVTWNKRFIPVETIPWRATNASIHRLAYPSLDTFYACDDAGIVWRTTDNGTDWDALIADTNMLNGIHFLDSKTGFIAGGNGCFSKTTDAGGTWTRQDIGAGDTTELYTMDFYNRNVGVVFGFGYSYITTDGGSSWIYKPTPVAGHNYLYTGRWMNDHQFFAFGPSGQVYNVSAINSDMTVTLLDSIIYAYGLASLWSPEYGGLVVGNLGLIMRSPDGLHWKATNQYYGGDAGLVATFGNAYYSMTGMFERSTDAGLSWSASSTGTDFYHGVSASALHFTDSLHGIAINTSDRSFSVETSDGGLTWSNAGLQFINPTPSYYLPFLGHTAFATSSPTWGSTVIWKTTDDGRTYAILDTIPPDWTTTPYVNLKPFEFGFLPWYMIDERTAYGIAAVRDTGIGHSVQHTIGHSLLYFTSDGGTSWSRVMNAPMTPSFDAVYFRDKSNGFIGCDSGTLYRTTDGGTTWSRTTIPMSPGPHVITAINFRDSLHGYLGTNDVPQVFATTDGGETWQNDHLDGAVQISGFLFPDSNTVLALSGGYYKRTIAPSGGGSGVAASQVAPTGLSIYPNPTTGLLHIESISNDFVITDLLGRTRMRTVSGDGTIDVSGLPQGVYSISDGKSRAQFVKE